MEAPLPIPTAHQPDLFRGRQYPTEFYARCGLQEQKENAVSVLGSDRAEGRRNDSCTAHEGVHRISPPSSDYEGQHHYHERGNHDSRPSPMPPPNALSGQLRPPRPRRPVMPIAHLVDESGPSEGHFSYSRPRNASLVSSPTSAPMSPRRGFDQSSQRLPGVATLLSGCSAANPPRSRPLNSLSSRSAGLDARLPLSQFNDRPGYGTERLHGSYAFENRRATMPDGHRVTHGRAVPGDMASGPLTHHHQRYDGYSTGSSLSSNFSSEPTSPHGSRHPQSYSPPRHSDPRSVFEHRRTIEPPAAQFMLREEDSYSSRIPHQRSHTLPSLPALAHATQRPAFDRSAEFIPNAMQPVTDPFYGRSQNFGLSPRPTTDYSFDQRPTYDSHVEYPPNYGHYSPYPHGAHPTNFSTRRRRGNLPKEATKMLRDWFRDHEDSPYPSEEDKQNLCEMTSLQLSQVNNWFINARRRLPRADAKERVEASVERGVTETSEESPVPVDYAEQADAPASNGYQDGGERGVNSA